MSDEELQNARRDLIAGQPDAATRLNRLLDRVDGLRDGLLSRIFDPNTADVVGLLVDASNGPVNIALPRKRPGVYDPVWVKKVDATNKPVLIVAPLGTLFENGEQVWYMPLVQRWESEGPFILLADGKTWMRV